MEPVTADRPRRWCRVLELHHDRTTSETHAPAIEKLYGSIWISSGAGSVIHLGGEPGDPVVQMYHLKPDALEVPRRSVGSEFAAEIVTAAAKEIGMSATVLDHAI